MIVGLGGNPRLGCKWQFVHVLLNCVKCLSVSCQYDYFTAYHNRKKQTLFDISEVLQWPLRRSRQKRITYFYIMLLLQLLYRLLSQNFAFFKFLYSHSPFFPPVFNTMQPRRGQLTTLCICFSTEVTFDHPSILHLWDRHSGIITTNGLQMHESSSACFGEDYTDKVS